MTKTLNYYVADHGEQGNMIAVHFFKYSPHIERIIFKCWSTVYDQRVCD